MLKLLRVLGILLAQGAGTPIELQKIAHEAGLPLSTTHRILQLCTSFGIVQQDSDHRYALGPAMVAVGMSAVEGEGLRDIAQDALAWLAATSREEAYLTMHVGYDGVFTARCRSPHPIRVVEPLFERLPLHCGASRKVLLAYLGEPFLAEYLKERPLQRYTDRTITEPDQLRRELTQIVERGYAVSNGERSIGVAGIAAPVFGPQGTVLASVAVLAPVDSILGDRQQELIDNVRQAAQDISDRIRIPDAWRPNQSSGMDAGPNDPPDERIRQRSGKHNGKVSSAK